MSARAKKLRLGYSTGGCAAAAAKAAVRRLLGDDPGRVSLELPWKRDDAAPVSFEPVGIETGDGWASAGIVKDAGDDPDVTNRAEIRCAVGWTDRFAPQEVCCVPEPVEAYGEAVRLKVQLCGGAGVGRVTKPGLAPEVGGPAINPVPREMIAHAILQGLVEAGYSGVASLRAVVSVPEGEERAKKTMNARLGILGGISILGTTGMVVPLSRAAWKATIDACLDVSVAAGMDRAILATGRSSELAAQVVFPELAGQPAVLMGDHVGYALDRAAERGIGVVVAGQFAKFVKIGSGEFQTHVSKSTLNLGILGRLFREAGLPEKETREALNANTARQVFTTLVMLGDKKVFNLLTREVADLCGRRVNEAIPVEAVLLGYDKSLIAKAVGGRAG